MVMMQFLSRSRRCRCASTTGASLMLDTVSPVTSTKSLLSRSFWSSTRSASPVDTQLVDTTVRTLTLPCLPHLDSCR
jgi:hypothetical protein